MIENRRRAFVLDRVAYDLTSLVPQWVKDESDVVLIFDSLSTDGIPRPSVWSKEFQKQVIQILDKLKFDTELDYFVVTGHFVPITTACCIFGMLFDTFTILQFSNAERAYIAIRVEYQNADTVS